MLAREKWQVRTLRALEIVFEERKRQKGLHGDAMRALPDGIGPEVQWLDPIVDDGIQQFANSGEQPVVTAQAAQSLFRREYEKSSARGELSKMHLVREELAELFELDPDDPEFIAECSQVAALCVQWIEYKLEEAEPKPNTKEQNIAARKRWDAAYERGLQS